MIPKKIHYCWFGGGEPTESVLKCIESWKKFCPEYEIIQWNETNYDVNQNEYIKQAYSSKKWAFVSDYARLDILYCHGGVYLDTDVELIKNLDPLLENKAFVGKEAIDSISTGLGAGAEKGLPIVKELKDIYDKMNFFVNGKPNEVTCVEITTKYLQGYGYQNNDEFQIVKDLSIYPIEYFCPLKPGSLKLNITKNTYSIHWFEGSWKNSNVFLRKLEFYLIPLKKVSKKTINNLFGEDSYEKLKLKIKNK